MLVFCPQVFISLYQDSCHSSSYFIPKQHYLKQEGRGKGQKQTNKQTISLQASLLLWKENLPLPAKSSVDFTSLPGTGSHDHPLSSVRFSPSIMSDSLRPHGLQHARFPCPSTTPRVTQTQVQQVGDAIQPPHPLSLPFCPALVFSSIRVSSSESVLRNRWPKYWSFSFSISPSNEYSGLISFRTDWLDLLTVQGTLKSLPQHHSSKAWILLITL